MWASINRSKESPARKRQRASELIVSELKGKYDKALDLHVNAGINDENVNENGNNECISLLDNVINEGLGHMNKLRDQSELKQVRNIIYLAMKNISEILEKEGNFQKSLEFAYSAFEFDQTNSFLLFRIARLACYLKDFWTCNEILKRTQNNSNLLSQLKQQLIEIVDKNKNKTVVGLPYTFGSHVTHDLGVLTTLLQRDDVSDNSNNDIINNNGNNNNNNNNNSNNNNNDSNNNSYYDSERNNYNKSNTKKNNDAESTSLNLIKITNGNGHKNRDTGSSESLTGLYSSSNEDTEGKGEGGLSSKEERVTITDKLSDNDNSVEAEEIVTKSSSSTDTGIPLTPSINKLVKTTTNDTTASATSSSTSSTTTAGTNARKSARQRDRGSRQIERALDHDVSITISGRLNNCLVTLGPIEMGGQDSEPDEVESDLAFVRRVLITSQSQVIDSEVVSASALGKMTSTSSSSVTFQTQSQDKATLLSAHQNEVADKVPLTVFLTAVKQDLQASSRNEISYDQLSTAAMNLCVLEHISFAIIDQSLSTNYPLPRPEELRTFILESWNLLKHHSQSKMRVNMEIGPLCIGIDEYFLFSECLLDEMIELQNHQSDQTKEIIQKLSDLRNDLLLILLPIINSYFDNSFIINKKTWIKDDCNDRSYDPYDCSRELRMNWMSLYIHQARFEEMELDVTTLVTYSVNSMRAVMEGDQLFGRLVLPHTSNIISVIDMDSATALISDLLQGDAMRKLAREATIIRTIYFTEDGRNRMKIWFESTCQAFESLDDIFAILPLEPRDDDYILVDSSVSNLLFMIKAGLELEMVEKQLLVMGKVLKSIINVSDYHFGVSNRSEGGQQILKIVKSCIDFFPVNGDWSNVSEEVKATMVDIVNNLLIKSYIKVQYNMLRHMSMLSVQILKCISFEIGEKLLQTCGAIVLDTSDISVEHITTRSRRDTMSTLDAISDLVVSMSQLLYSNNNIDISCSLKKRLMAMAGVLVDNTKMTLTRTKVDTVDKGTTSLVFATILVHPNLYNDRYRYESIALCHSILQFEGIKQSILSIGAMKMIQNDLEKNKGAIMQQSWLLKTALHAYGRMAQDIYGIPINNNTPNMTTMSKEIDSHTLHFLVSYFDYAEQLNLVNKASLRMMYQWMSNLDILKDLSYNYEDASKQLISDILFNEERRKDISAHDMFEKIARLLPSAQTQETIDGNEESQRLIIRTRIKKYLSNTATSDAIGLGLGSLEVLSQMEKRAQSLLFPCFEAAIVDPYDFHNWWRIFSSVVELAHCCEDTIGDVCNVESIHEAWHQFNFLSTPSVVFEVAADVLSCLDRRQSKNYTELADNNISMLCAQKNELQIIVSRLLQVLKFLAFDHRFEESDNVSANRKKSFDCMEILGMTLYNSAVLYKKNSDLHNKRIQEAEQIFTEACGLASQKSSTTPYFSIWMQAKLKWQLQWKTKDADLARVLFDSLNLLASIGNIEHPSFKTLKLNVTYQTHSMRIKAAIKALKEKSYSERLNKVLIDSRFHTKAHQDLEGTEIIGSQRTTILMAFDAIRGLKACRTIEQHDSKSVYRLAEAYHELSLLDVRLEGITHSGDIDDNDIIKCCTSEGSLNEIWKLFDKKRPQIAALWCQESASTPFDMLIQRTFKFDALRKKFLSLYITLLEKSRDYRKAGNTLTFCYGSKKRTPAVRMMTESMANCFVRIVQNCLSSGTEELQRIELLRCVYDVTLSLQKHTGLAANYHPSFSTMNHIVGFLKQLAMLCFPQEATPPSTEHDSLLVWSLRKCREYFASLSTSNTSTSVIPAVPTPLITHCISINHIGTNGVPGQRN